jgi:starch phosphorylase
VGENIVTAVSERFPKLPGRIKGLGDMAYNLWWSWHPEARMLYKMLSRRIWKERLHNPVRLLNEIPEEVLQAAATDPVYLRTYDEVYARFKDYVAIRPGWFSENVTKSNLLPVAYFSAEYGLHHSLPFYAGGLGFLAGDILKECSDLSVPFVAVGFMYPGGYFLQKVNENGWQEESEQKIDKDAAPITKVLNDDGRQMVVRVPFIESSIYVAVWKVMVGRIPLYLMDTDIDKNESWNRNISARLYIGNIEQRLRQEIVLGIGGYEILRALGIKHSLLRLNEGHPAFAILERIREKVQNGVRFETAVEEVQNSTIFTTHTPVPAGHDVFPYPLMERYFNAYWPSLGIDRQRFFQLGLNPVDPGSGFNMTAFALRLSRYRNGVSKRHGEVSRRMWRSLWPDTPEDKIPIGHVTNGVHLPTWINPKIQILLNKHVGPQWIEDQDNPATWAAIDDIPDEELWQIHYRLKEKLLFHIREKARRRWITDRVNPSVVLAEGSLLDPDVLTIGFARRFATYKRHDLILNDMQRLKNLLNHPWRPVQIVFSGKAHPEDDFGKQVLQRVFRAAGEPDIGGRIAFVEDYGEQLAQYLAHGVDVWLNNPIPPLEASGTSGMKAAVNGVPALSILDGWWIEGFNGKNGWAFEGGEGDNRDAKDAEAIYNILEKEIIPLYYDIGDDGVPHGWVGVMKEAIKSTASGFSSRRCIKEYIKTFYFDALRLEESGVMTEKKQ